MKTLNLIDELLSALHQEAEGEQQLYPALKKYLALQKEYFRLDLEERISRLFATVCLVLAVCIVVVIGLCYAIGPIITFALLVIALLIGAVIGRKRMQKVSQAKNGKTTEIKTAQAQLEESIREVTAPVDVLLSVWQGVQMFSSLIQKIKAMFNRFSGKGEVSA